MPAIDVIRHWSYTGVVACWQSLPVVDVERQVGFSKSFRGGVVPSAETVVQVILPTSCLCLIKHQEQTQPSCSIDLDNF